MAILADGSSYLDRYVESVIEAEGFAASRCLLFLHLMLSGPRRPSRSSGTCSRIGSVTTLSKPGEARAKKLRELNKRVVEFHSRCAQFGHFSAALEKDHRQDERLFPWGFRSGKFEVAAGDRQESIAMETLYDLLGALPDDDADELRTAFRRAVKRVHPDINPEDLDAGLKFRRIVRANEILGDAEQRAAYDHLLALAHHEQEQAAKEAAAFRIALSRPCAS